MPEQERALVLVAEDDPDDVLLLQQAISRAAPQVLLRTCPDGAEAINYLQGSGPYADRAKNPVPRAVITDLKMPRCNGFELLEWVKSHPQFAVIPTVVFTSSSHDADVRRAFQLGANAYFQKPTSFDELVTLVKLNYEFWRRARLPVAENSAQPKGPSATPAQPGASPQAF
jgi:CheY-like chemotaxis protein